MSLTPFSVGYQAQVTHRPTISSLKLYYFKINFCELSLLCSYSKFGLALNEDIAGDSGYEFSQLA
jgi:hypothetical protein